MSDSPLPIIDITTVSDTGATLHITPVGGGSAVQVVHVDGLTPGIEQQLALDPAHAALAGVESLTVRTLRSMTGPATAVFATVNDVHFGETVAGQIDDHEMGPIRRAAPGATPYPEVMNHAAADEMAAIELDAVIVKGDLSLDGAPEEWAAFEACYRARFAERLSVVRGNHDAYRGQDEYAGDQLIELAGVSVALLDTVIPGATTGNLTAEQADWLDAVAADSTQPVIAMGHHQQWIADADEGRRSDDYFGLHPDGSDRLDDVCARRDSIIAYTAGHTHRHRVRTMTTSGVPSIEIGCTKDFPGTWAEYRVHADGVMQIVHRISAPAALEWSEPCRQLYEDFGVDYSTYALGSLDERCFVIELR